MRVENDGCSADALRIASLRAGVLNKYTALQAQIAELQD
jgi:hypothetical protein